MSGDITYKVDVWKTYVYKGKRGKTYTVRWKLGGKEKPDHATFKKSAQAETYRSALVTAARGGQAFSLATGEPVAWERRERQAVTWYDFTCRYVDMKWKAASAKYRQDIARALVAASPPMVSGRPPYTEEELRTALRRWGFNTKQRPHAPAEVERILKWLSTNTKAMSALTSKDDAGLPRAVLDAATSKLDGTIVAASTARRHRVVLNNALDYAVELDLLAANPVRDLKWTAPESNEEVDRRVVVDPTRARRLLKAVRRQSPSGPRLVAFFGLMYYCGLRPEEAVAVRRDDFRMPPRLSFEAWAELDLRRARPIAGREWTDDGEEREDRALKHRADGATRHVPVPPHMVRLLWRHFDLFADGPTDGRLFYGVRSNELPKSTISRAWKQARRDAFTNGEVSSPLAGRPYDLRHACLSTWLNAGVPAPQVAEWAGHSTKVLLTIYAKCIVGQEDMLRRRIMDALAAA